MVAAIGPEEGEQALVRLTKVGSRFDREDIGEVRFQPIAQGPRRRPLKGLSRL